MGQVVQAGAGQNPARQAAVAAGLPWTVPATTINKVCLSGLTAIIDAARMIRLGEASVVVAGGQESMSQAPHLLPGSRRGWTYGDIQAVDSLAFDGLTDAFDRESMGSSTERGNKALSIAREAQDRVAVESHRRAAAAVQSGVFAEEIVPVEVPQRRGAPVVVSLDEGIRPETTVESLASLRPAFSADGTITAGNASPLTDGAAAVVVAARDVAEAHGLTWLATVGASGQVAGPDNSLHSQPSAAISAALAQGRVVRWTPSTSSRSTRRSGPSSCSRWATWRTRWSRRTSTAARSRSGTRSGRRGRGSRVTPRSELARRGQGRAAVALCGGGGQGEALLLSRD